ncbi:MAG: hypothetical protein ABEI11_00090 [Haloarculaceae archaeon]
MGLKPVLCTQRPRTRPVGSSNSVGITIPMGVVRTLELETGEYPETIGVDPETRTVMFQFGDDDDGEPEAALSLPEQLENMDPDTSLADD